MKDVYPSVKSAKSRIKPVKSGMKSVRRGIRLWTEYDAKTCYVYETKIFPEKKDSCLEVKLRWKSGYKAVPINQK